MSIFLSYSRAGDLVGGFSPLSVLRRGGTAWATISNRDANTPAWLDDTTVIFQQGAYSNHDVHIQTTDGQRFERKASTLYAGGGRWVAFLATIPPVLYDGESRTITGAGQHSVGVDGTLAYCPTYHVGRGVVVEDSHGQEIARRDDIPVTSVSCIDRQAIGVFSAAESRYLWFWNGSTWSRHQLAFPAYDGAIVRGGDGAILVLNGSQQLAVHRLEDASKGWLFGRSGKGYNGVAWTNPSTKETFIAWSENAGATIESVREERLIGDPQPWPKPSAVVPTFVVSPYAIGVGMFDDMDGPRLMDATEVPSSNVRAVFHHVGRGDVSVSMRIAKLLGWPCLFWWDGHGADPTDVPPGGRALLYGYASEERPISETVRLFKNDAEAMKKAGVPFDAGVLLTRKFADKPPRYAITEQHALDCAAGIWKASIEKRAGAVWIFSKRRGLVDGVDAFPSFQRAAARMRNASVDWRIFPKYQTTPSAPVWFTEAGSFLMADIKAKGIKVTVGWENDLPVWRFLRVPSGGGEKDIFLDAEAPTDETAVLLQRRGPGECAALFTHAHKQLALTPMREWETRDEGAIGVFETFRDVALPPDKAKTIVHVYGLVAHVVL